MLVNAALKTSWLVRETAVKLSAHYAKYKVKQGHSHRGAGSPIEMLPRIAMN